ncbi:hypothetical protein [Tengunoibacter tsumagoiensis]|uniref:Uncharacterized protein n=1 Tax=Tengunoibacter tsumagoiensis TaxID=2014871 RepID=A0A402A2K1_9CHLR|nr:hypothetical protein [Tengunoibacter tsumagoiensis]GCE13373.1 hypothetical protein KTT_32320 [Tengunoibacter tsumagoiensis]
MPNAQIMTEIAPYQSWLTIAGVFVLFGLLRLTRKGLRRRVDESGYRLFRSKGPLIWFWLNAPGVIIHELSHAFVVLLFWPFGFRITSITLFRIKPIPQRNAYGQVMRGGPASLQLGEVQYVRPQRALMSFVGDGISGVAPLLGGTAAFIFLYWVATGYNLWDIPLDSVHSSFKILRPGWPWWTLLFAPYLILTVTSELWPSRQDWRGARWFVAMLTVLLICAGVAIWYYNLTSAVLTIATFAASRLDFALLILVALDLVFLVIAEAIVQLLRS